MKNTYIPHVERLLAVAGAAGTVTQVLVGNTVAAAAMATLAIALVIFGYANRRRTLSLEACLQDEIRTLVKDRMYYVAIRWAEAVSRALWLDGSYRTRIEIGKLAIKAADSLGPDATRQKIRALIDDCGWTSIEMGRLEEGERFILEGIRLAEEHNWPYMRAKGLRHLAGRQLRGENFALAENTLAAALSATLAAPEGVEKDELLAEWYYAQGVLQLARDNVSQADQSISEAEKAYAKLPSREWRAKIQVRRGEIEFRSGDAAKALGIFSEAKAVAARHHYKRVQVKAEIWLAKVYLHLNQVREAKAELASAKRAVSESEMLHEQRILTAVRTEIGQHDGHDV
jgi:tetratricopeptide (TPR) repeat protein